MAKNTEEEASALDFDQVLSQDFLVSVENAEIDDNATVENPLVDKPEDPTQIPNPVEKPEEEGEEPDEELNVSDDEKQAVEEPPEKEDEQEDEDVVEPSEKTRSDQSPSDEIDDNSSSSSDTYKLFAKANYEEGVLTDFDEKEFEDLAEKYGPVNAMIELNRRTILSEVDRWKGTLPKEIHTLIDNYQDGVPLKDLIDNRSKAIEYNKITEEHLEDNNDMQEEILRRDLMSRGFTEEEAKEEISLYADNDISYKKATQALARLRKAEDNRLEKLRLEAKQNQEQEERRREEAINEIKTHVGATKEIIPGMTINKRDQDQIVDALTNVVNYDKNGTPLNAIMETRSRNPLAFDNTIAYLYTLGVFNLDDGNNPTPDWSKVMTKSKTQVVKELEKKFEKAKTFRPGKSADVSRGTDGKSKESFITNLDVDRLK